MKDEAYLNGSGQKLCEHYRHWKRWFLRSLPETDFGGGDTGTTAEGNLFLAGGSNLSIADLLAYEEVLQLSPGGVARQTKILALEFPKILRGWVA
jgi:hypothetical protein